MLLNIEVWKIVGLTQEVDWVSEASGSASAAVG